MASDGRPGATLKGFRALSPLEATQFARIVRALAATAAPRAAPARPPAAPAAAACPRRCATMSSRMRLLARCASQHNDLLRPALRGHREKKEQSALMLCACMRVVV